MIHDVDVFREKLVHQEQRPHRDVQRQLLFYFANQGVAERLAEIRVPARQNPVGPSVLPVVDEQDPPVRHEHSRRPHRDLAHVVFL